MLHRQTMPATGRFPDFLLPTVISEQIASHITFTSLGHHTQPIVLLNIVLHISDWDTKKPGMARLMAKLLMRGTEKRSASMIAETIERQGASINIQSTRDAIHLEVRALSSTFLSLLPLIVDMLANPAFEEREVATIKKRLVEEIKQERASIGHLATLELTSLIFGASHPYGYKVALDTLEHITATELQQCYKDYGWQKCQIFLTGDIDEKVINVTKEAFSQMEAVPVAKCTHLLQPGPPTLSITKDSLQGAIGIGRRTITRKHEDYPVLYVANTILGGYFGSRLMRNIREEKGYSYGAFSVIHPLRRHGYWQVATHVKKEYIEATCTEIYKEIERLQRELVEKEELVAVQNYLVGQLLGGFNCLFSTTNQLCSIHLHSLDLTHYQQLYNEFQQITPCMIQDIAHRYFDVNTLHQVVIR